MTESFQWGTGYILDTGVFQVNAEISERAARQYVDSDKRFKSQGVPIAELFTRTVMYGPWVPVTTEKEEEK